MSGRNPEYFGVNASNIINLLVEVPLRTHLVDPCHSQLPVLLLVDVEVAGLVQHVVRLPRLLAVEHRLAQLAPEQIFIYLSNMEFVKNFTPPDFQAKNFTPSISPNFNSFSKKKHKK